MPKKSNKKSNKNEIKQIEKNENEIDKAESEFKLLNTKVLKQQQLNYEMSIDNFLKSNGLITLSY
jgi:hypothetical protein